ncbi:Nuclear protein localization protein 4 [Intoshia linei]|uniref:Nuclear protein localization protein 4 n=1 Tax=Intoshia linei TaxID=1819745 RepID=A0A177AUN7_9BILA|nr:Nuclear protein localization protein 4 [Intoshia linei]
MTLDTLIVMGIISKRFKSSQIGAEDLYLDKNFVNPLLNMIKMKSIGDILKNGDMVYIKDKTKDDSDTELKFTHSASDASFISIDHSILESVDKVDSDIDKMDGKIYRSRDKTLCNHGENSLCVHCSPLECYENDVEAKSLKFLPFHAHVRKLLKEKPRTSDKKHLIKPIRYTLKSGCMNHLPYPNGICSQCQPKSVYLARQTFRFIDYIQFENGDFVDRFLNYWRETGCQRFGYLIGYYDLYDHVPLGVKAVVCSIYEPSQINKYRSIYIERNNANDSMDNVIMNSEKDAAACAKKLNMVVVGCIFTDLESNNGDFSSSSSSANVKHNRCNDLHYVSSEEMIMMAQYQNYHKNRCTYSENGYYGSKFVTVVVSGDKNGEISFDGYQVSNQCCDLVKHNFLIPAYESADKCYVIEASKVNYVPDIFYSYTDKYKNNIVEKACPFGIEYGLIELQCAFSTSSSYSFFTNKSKKNFFPIENRLTEIQNDRAVVNYLKQFTSDDERFHAMCDFHLISYLYKSSSLIDKSAMDQLCDIYCKKNFKSSDVADTLVQFYYWMENDSLSTLKYLFNETDTSQTCFKDSPKTPKTQNTQIDDSIMTDHVEENWSCQHCTFINTGNSRNCSMCGLPINT